MPDGAVGAHLEGLRTPTVRAVALDKRERLPTIIMGLWRVRVPGHKPEVKVVVTVVAKALEYFGPALAHVATDCFFEVLAVPSHELREGIDHVSDEAVGHLYVNLLCVHEPLRRLLHDMLCPDLVQELVELALRRRPAAWRTATSAGSGNLRLHDGLHSLVMRVVNGFHGLMVLLAPLARLRFPVVLSLRRGLSISVPVAGPLPGPIPVPVSVAGPLARTIPIPGAIPVTVALPGPVSVTVALAGPVPVTVGAPIITIAPAIAAVFLAMPGTRHYQTLLLSHASSCAVCYARLSAIGLQAKLQPPLPPA
mmetsp:Transcript_83566/g.233230  ORF Transcript_83566/g.233230 Transcript_83566/m.233230 type:complete len:309 (+) Transcript_83566:49-975(+)